MSNSGNCCKSTVGASILNCNFINIRNEVDQLLMDGVDFIHLDIMDGNFVDDITFGPSFVASLIQHFPMVCFEVHMMVKHPMKFIEPMSKAGVQRYIFHYEVTKDAEAEAADGTVAEICSAIRSSKMETAMAINPETPVQVLESSSLVSLLDSVLIMTVRPGRGGQEFMPEMLTKVKRLRELYPKMEIGLDGGCSLKNVHLAGNAGANRAVCGSSLLKAADRATFIFNMRSELFPVHNR